MVGPVRFFIWLGQFFLRWSQQRSIWWVPATFVFPLTRTFRVHSLRPSPFTTHVEHRLHTTNPHPPNTSTTCTQDHQFFLEWWCKFGPRCTDQSWGASSGEVGLGSSCWGQYGHSQPWVSHVGVLVFMEIWVGAVWTGMRYLCNCCGCRRNLLCLLRVAGP